MPSFSRFFRSGTSKKQKAIPPVIEETPSLPTWVDPWSRSEIAPSEAVELLSAVTAEVKLRALDIPFLLLPFRPLPESGSIKIFIRHYFDPPPERVVPLRGDELKQELRLVDPIVLCCILKWCWSRLPKGVVTWEAYKLFRLGEENCNLARDSFITFIPIAVDRVRARIITDFFDLLTAVAAHAKSNGLTGRKLSRYAGWWAFEHTDSGNGFEASYRSWEAAADATSHLFFAYLRSLASRANSLNTVPTSLQTLVQATEYPPKKPLMLQRPTTKLVMIVSQVSPGPFALLRRAKGFEYREKDAVLKHFAEMDDPLKLLTEECTRVLRAITRTNQGGSLSSHHSSDVGSSENADDNQLSLASQKENTWSTFESVGFLTQEEDYFDLKDKPTSSSNVFAAPPLSLGQDRPTTPSWAEFLHSGFADENSLGLQQSSSAPRLLPPDTSLPPVLTVTGDVQRGYTSQSARNFSDEHLDPGELASINTLQLDDSFWWVWISSLAAEETTARKGVFGRCALVETTVPIEATRGYGTSGKQGNAWLVLEEQVRGAAPEPAADAYITEKKGLFGIRSRINRTVRRKNNNQPPQTSSSMGGNNGNNQAMVHASTSPQLNTPRPNPVEQVNPELLARIQTAASQLARRDREATFGGADKSSTNNNSNHSARDSRVDSMIAVQGPAFSEVSRAMKWASMYDNDHTALNGSTSNLIGSGAPPQPSSAERQKKPMPKLPEESKKEEQATKAAAPAPAPTPALAPVPAPVQRTPPSPSSAAPTPRKGSLLSPASGPAARENVTSTNKTRLSPIEVNGTKKPETKVAPKPAAQSPVNNSSAEQSKPATKPSAPVPEVPASSNRAQPPSTAETTQPSVQKKPSIPNVQTGPKAASPPKEEKEPASKPSPAPQRNEKEQSPAPASTTAPRKSSLSSNASEPRTTVSSSVSASKASFESAANDATGGTNSFGDRVRPRPKNVSPGLRSVMERMNTNTGTTNSHHAPSGPSHTSGGHGGSGGVVAATRAALEIRAAANKISDPAVLKAHTTNKRLSISSVSSQSPKSVQSRSDSPPPAIPPRASAPNSPSPTGVERAPTRRSQDTFMTVNSGQSDAPTPTAATATAPAPEPTPIIPLAQSPIIPSSPRPSLDQQEPPTPTIQDRWAQIRKQAAERSIANAAANNADEESTAPKSVRRVSLPPKDQKNRRSMSPTAALEPKETANVENAAAAPETSTPEAAPTDAPVPAPAPAPAPASPSPSANSGNDANGDSPRDETIEEKVARIRARVAQLTASGDNTA